ncbi:unnamed protein product [Vitrella brassicaformis CCMP3155]|uniref:SCP domain-containing protein n=1 Tax=Vitrella brassicaformis (strain CCMP3155) TaxID=1169540 RepID=A0A0G4GZU1_VITBC|nr:unnamed protein product [Vitrella brassicaformis CCMP3155]|eukprot:CEM36798.1 unnamed protein product [Vitrella brassicaformis CCMP3155]
MNTQGLLCLLGALLLAAAVCAEPSSNTNGATASIAAADEESERVSGLLRGLTRSGNDTSGASVRRLDRVYSNTEYFYQDYASVTCDNAYTTMMRRARAEAYDLLRVNSATYVEDATSRFCSKANAVDGSKANAVDGSYNGPHLVVECVSG